MSVEAWTYIAGWHGEKEAERLYRNESTGEERLLRTRSRAGRLGKGQWYQRRIGDGERSWKRITEIEEREE